MARYLELKRARDRAYRERNRDRLNAIAKERMAKYYKSEKYQAWLAGSRERRKEYKAQQRRKAGCKLRSEITKLKEQSAAEFEKRKADRSEFTATFTGPPKPTPSSIGYAAYYAWRYANDEAFRTREVKRTRDKKLRLPDYYVLHLLNMKQAPKALIECKRYNTMIKRFLGDRDEEHNAAAR